jgi:N-acetylneuraminic acid mutarotase
MKRVALAGSALALIALCPTSASAAALRWHHSPHMHDIRAGLAAARGADGRIYAIGGVFAFGRAEAFSPARRTWTRIADPPDRLTDLAAATANHGRIYTMGGDGDGGAVATVSVYTPWRNRWRHVAPMPTARALLAAATGRDGRIYAFGGTAFGFIGEVMDAVEAYNPATDTWTRVRPMPTARAGAAAVAAPDGKIYVIGGYDLATGFLNPLNTVEAYDPATNRWSSKAPMPTRRELLGAAVGRDGRIYAVAGENNSHQSLRKVEAYSPATDTWRPAPFLFVPRNDLGVVAGSDGTVYAIGGCIYNCFTDDQPIDLVEALR